MLTTLAYRGERRSFQTVLELAIAQAHPIAHGLELHEFIAPGVDGLALGFERLGDPASRVLLPEPRSPTTYDRQLLAAQAPVHLFERLLYVG